MCVYVIYIYNIFFLRLSFITSNHNRLDIVLSVLYSRTSLRIHSRCNSLHLLTPITPLCPPRSIPSPSLFHKFLEVKLQDQRDPQQYFGSYGQFVIQKCSFSSRVREPVFFYRGEGGEFGEGVSCLPPTWKWGGGRDSAELSLSG